MSKLRRTVSTNDEHLADIISDESYLRQRQNPDLKDEYYLVLSDLKLALRQVASNDSLRILDYGCGGSPYQQLFPNAVYQRADYVSSPDTIIDYLLDEDSRISAPDDSFDLVITTQVAEHVSNPEVFFSECFRVLRKGGKLICTTHGQWEDHGCPYDFQRWTAEGLKRDVKKQGFEVQDCYKLTTGPRALLAQVISQCGHLHGGRKSITGFILTLFREAVKKFRRKLHSHADWQYKNFRVVQEQEKGHNFYICLMIVGIKPED